MLAPPAATRGAASRRGRRGRRASRCSRRGARPPPRPTEGQRRGLAATPQPRCRRQPRRRCPRLEARGGGWGEEGGKGAPRGDRCAEKGARQRATARGGGPSAERRGRWARYAARYAVDALPAPLLCCATTPAPAGSSSGGCKVWMEGGASEAASRGSACSVPRVVPRRSKRESALKAAQTAAAAPSGSGTRVTAGPAPASPPCGSRPIR
mmetsp:Transcript_48623/g.162262  ORF Transcript_48623/g.162262 Transcript_48623/m.162262 type:complete len:210 (+) Transcript_48623:818-1447(+)